MNSLHIALVGVSLAIPVQASEITSVFVMHDSDRAAVDLDWSGVPTSVLDLATARQIDEQMSESFNQHLAVTQSMPQEQLQQVVTERMQVLVHSGQMEGWMAQYRAWGNELAKSSQYRLTKAPAIVFNDRYTVYGVSSLKAAVELFYQASAQ
jgi:hypothetical protein